MIYELPQGRIHEGDWLQADLEPGYSLAIVDGPYGMGKGGWDRLKVDQLADWYAPHIARLSALCAKSATVYLWNTAEGWARLDPVMRAAGWAFRSLIVWDKRKSPASINHTGLSAWIDITEVCGMYQRGGPAFSGTPGGFNVWRELLGDSGERLVTGKTWKRKQVGANEKEPLHPCQKPLAFAERMIRASSRPGERVLVPFGGTCREAVICEWLARTDPKEARRYDVCELNQDGPDYIGAALAQIRGEDTRKANPAQVRLFGAAK